MTISKSEIILLTQTPEEFEGVANHVKDKTFTKFKVTIMESGLGKINAALKLASELTLRNEKGNLPSFIAGVGTSGSLDKSLVDGDVVASIDSVIFDWRHEDGKEVLVGPYGTFDYEAISPKVLEKISLKSDSLILKELIDTLSRNGFKIGRVLTSDTFVAGKDLKLSLGKVFNALVCDMESGAFAWTAQKCHNIPWFNLRVVADTLDETLQDYFRKEIHVTDILGKKTLEALRILNDILERVGTA
jgi:nucleoside phosphorylase